MRSIALIFLTIFSGMTALAAAPADFTLHEWGTFTSVSGSDGILLPGLEREEEALPRFVIAHDGMPGSPFKGLARPLHNVTIKLETPVIYFYTAQPFKAHVRVGFNGGSISQWFPARSGGEIPPAYTNKNGVNSGGDIDFAKPYKGAIEWNVQIQPSSPADSAAVFKPGETPGWLYPRQTDSALVRTPDGAAEKYLFYRGVGNFALPVKFMLPDDHTLRIQNNSTSAVPALLIFNHPQYSDKASFLLLDPVDAGETHTVDLAVPVDSTTWRRDVYAAMHRALVQAGLFPKEADAMVQTWWNSYFEQPGLRVFWIVPENVTNSVLPLTVEPAPRQQVRVLVGRSELLTPNFEHEMLSQFAMGEKNSLQSDRFFFAYQARVNALKTRR